jgi:hypothetical protein
MSIRAASIGAALLLAGGPVATAQAQEIILYDGPNFTGQQVRVTGADRNLSSRGFNDRTSSFRIVSGEWEVCQHDDYNGTCETHRNDQPALGRMDNQITSVRPAYIGRPGPDRPGYPGRPGRHESSLTLYSGYNFTGRSVTITDSIDNLQRLGFNDEARSIRHSGRRAWRVCQHANFEGACMEVDGDIPSIGGGMAAQISSVEPDYGSRPDRHRPGRPGWDRPGADSRPRSGIFLYDGPNFTGQRVDVSWDINNLSELGFNDRTDSLVVARGETWVICEHDDLGGRCERVQGEIADLGRYGLRNEITSLRRIDDGYGGWNDGGYRDGGWNQGGEIILYDQFSQRGRSVRIRDEITNLERLGFNDQALSLEVLGYDRWLVCEDADFRGRCEEVSGEVDNLHLLNREISSVRRLGRY